MDRTLHLVGKNSSEIIMVRYPRSLLNFCEYDLAYFAENAISVCDDALRDGELDFDRVTELRNSLKSAHVYIENNIRSTYDKIVLDCWIDYVCRRDNVGTSTLWNRFMPCNTAFEKAVFVRLCDYRYNRGINEWLNLVRVQDYAKNKISFIFSGELSGADDAAARRNYFDLMFSVTARELGCRIEELGVTKVFSVGRVPSSPFMFPNISKDIVKNLLADFDYSEDYSEIDNYGSLSDQIAMDAFSYMKSGLAQEYSSYNISRSEMENSPTKVYMPCGLKAVVDLEIDALIESGGWLARCKRCGRYYVRDAKYDHDYCSLFTPGGNTCLKIYEAEHPKSRIPAELDRAFRDITDEMYARVDRDMSLEEYESWKVYLDALYGKVENGEIPVEELEDFIGYSRVLDISRSNPVTEVKKPEPERPSRERVVKPFVPQRIDRSELEAQMKPTLPVEEEEDEEIPQQRGKSFFTSPTVQRQKSREAAPMAHIIRGEQPVESYAPASNVFTPFGAQPPVQQPQYAPPKPQTQSARLEPYKPRPASERKPAAPIQELDLERVTEKLMQFREMEQPTVSAPEEQEPVFDIFGDVQYESSDNLETYGNVFDLERDGVTETPSETVQKPKVIKKNARAISAYGKMSGAPVLSQAEFEAVSAPAPVAEEDPFKDVSAIFDDIQNAPSQKAPVEAVATEPEPPVQPVVTEEASPIAEMPPVFEMFDAAQTDEPSYYDELPREASAEKHEPEAFFSDKSIFSEDMFPAEEAKVEKPKQTKGRKRTAKPSEPAEAPRAIPDKVTTDNAPSGIWTEERNLFPEADPEELEMLKDKKRSGTRSNKTQRLFDAIMREPEDNPNVRRKKNDI
ncbi:MAG: hypothetical protein IJZ95_07935 [Oscillospiraceae bacterium]|nr:hypothetical protein [Oscillospiraceae bacterium]